MLFFYELNTQIAKQKSQAKATKPSHDWFFLRILCLACEQ